MWNLKTLRTWLFILFLSSQNILFPAAAKVSCNKLVERLERNLSNPTTLNEVMETIRKVEVKKNRIEERIVEISKSLHGQDPSLRFDARGPSALKNVQRILRLCDHYKRLNETIYAFKMQSVAKLSGQQKEMFEFLLMEESSRNFGREPTHEYKNRWFFEMLLVDIQKNVNP